MASSSQKMRAWLREQGRQVTDRGPLSAADKAAYYAAHPDERPRERLEPIPGPDAPDEAFGVDDLGELVPDGGWDEPALPGPQGRAETRSKTRAYRAVPDGGGAPVADPGPAHATKEFRKRARADKAAARPGKVPAGIRADITAKIEFALAVPGSIWQARDPLCGGVFAQQAPEIAVALADIVCDSPDLVAFFTGPGGAFMRYLSLGAALMPVVQVVAAHHVYHSVGQEDLDATQPGYQAEYAA